MRNKILKIFTDILELDPNNITEINETFTNVFEIHYNDTIYTITNKEGVASIIDKYRRASIKDAQENIPMRFQRFFNFRHYADDIWQSIYDIYENVDEILYEGEPFYICSL